MNALGIFIQAALLSGLLLGFSSQIGFLIWDAFVSRRAAWPRIGRTGAAVYRLPVRERSAPADRRRTEPATITKQAA